MAYVSEYAAGAEDAIGSSRIAAAWEAVASTRVNVGLTDGQSHDLTVYAVDWNNQSRVEQIQIIDPATGDVLSTETLSSFTAGVYLQWVVTGNVDIVVTGISGGYCVLSGVFIDPVNTPVAAPTTSPAKTDTTTEGNWIGTYGVQGYDVLGDAASLPSYAIITPVGETSATWTASTTDPRALENPGGTGRSTTYWYSTTGFNIDVDLTDGQVHDLELYFVDWNTTARSEQVQLFAASGGTLLDTETVSSFHSGVYLEWAVSGNVVIKITSLAGANAVLSGLFLDPAMTAVPTVTGVSSSDSASTYGQSVTFTATVSNTIGAIPTGNVEFYDGSTDLGHGSALSGSGSSATSTFTTSTLTTGPHPAITAVYTSTGIFASSSGSLSQTVNAAVLSITANNASKTYGNTLTFAGTEFTTTGLVNGDTVTSVSLTSTGAVSSEQVASSSYAIVASAAEGNGLGNYAITYVNGQLTVNPRALIITATGVNKVYDGTTTATLTLSDNRVAGDTFTDTYSSALFAGSNAGTGKSVNVSGISITGPGAGNYTFTTTATTTANIAPMALTIRAVPNTKVYDGTTSAAAVPTITSGNLVAGDTADFTESYNTRNVGTGLTVTPGGEVTDDNGGKNYTYTFVAVTTGVIKAEALTIQAMPNTKVYDGTRSAAAIPIVTGLKGTDTATSLCETYAKRATGKRKILSVARYVINDGNGGKDYTVTTVASHKGVISPRHRHSSSASSKTQPKARRVFHGRIWQHQQRPSLVLSTADRRESPFRA